MRWARRKGGHSFIASSGFVVAVVAKQTNTENKFIWSAGVVDNLQQDFSSFVSAKQWVELVARLKGYR